MADTYPIRTREETADGYIIRTDYGPKQGATVVTVHLVPVTDAERKRIRENINRIIAPHGYKLAE